MEIAAGIQDLSTLKFIFWLTAIIIGVLVAIVAFFITRLVSDVRSNTTHIGRNKGTIELVKQKQESDIERVEKTTQIELQTLSKEMGNLTTSVQALVAIQMSNSKQV